MPLHDVISRDVTYVWYCPYPALTLKLAVSLHVNFKGNMSKFICLTSLTRAKCGVCSTLCWKVGNISGST